MTLKEHHLQGALCIANTNFYEFPSLGIELHIGTSSGCSQSINYLINLNFSAICSNFIFHILPPVRHKLSEILVHGREGF